MRTTWVRSLPWILLCLHILARILAPNPSLLLDLFLYNSIGICAALSIFLAKSIWLQGGKYWLVAGTLFWIAGSSISTYSEFFTRPSINQSTADALYMLLYPCLLFGLIRTIRGAKKFSAVEILDGTIIGIGLASIGTAFLMSPVLPHFTGDLTSALFAIFFPIADLILLASIAAISLMDAYSPRNMIVLLGISVFTLSDFLFLALTIRGKYSFGQLSDDGWLLGLVLISEGVWHRASDQRKSHALHPIFIALSVMTSALFLAITSLRPGYLPNYIIVPTVITLGLAFIRMTIALREARSIGEERTLARTDELTGLPNRRRFIAELTALSQDPKREGALLLMDLDGFKPINDQYGHEIGDQLLRQVSIRFQRALPHGALLARLGGDEFGALILGNYEATLEVALALKATLSYPFTFSGAEIMVGVSVGHVNNDGRADLLRRADQAMYQAKREGVGVWSESARSTINGRSGSNNF